MSSEQRRQKLERRTESADQAKEEGVGRPAMGVEQSVGAVDHCRLQRTS